MNYHQAKMQQRYKNNFDEFGQLRENHSRWDWTDSFCVAVAIVVIAVLASGVMVTP